MTDSEKLLKIKSFIDDYFRESQKRGHMYGSVSELEKIWILLDELFFIMNDLEEKKHNINFSSFLLSKGFGVKNAATVIMEDGTDKPYELLNSLWAKYILWRESKINNEGDKAG